jgi:histidyl-tRNA synthetase
MSGRKPDKRPEARLPKGMRDIEAPEIRAMERMLATIRRVYESYGFEPLDTPAFEYTEALGKFLPDQDRPNEGVFSFQDEDEQWLSLRYDLTAPLARYVAQNYDGLPKPFRRYQTGPVWRNEKPGPGRFRQFTQFDADTVGTESVAADAELCMLAADTMEALGLKGQFAVKLNNRKILDGVMDAAQIPTSKRLAVLRAIDKYDRLGTNGVRELLGKERKDESGAITKGADLSADQTGIIIKFVLAKLSDPPPPGSPEGWYAPEGFEIADGVYLDGVHDIRDVLANNSLFVEGASEIGEIIRIVRSANFDHHAIRFDQSVVRGLEYYTGPVLEVDQSSGPFLAERGEHGQPVRFGSVGGGGRYDGLVSRFKGTTIPATGFSIGVSRLYTALQALRKLDADAVSGPVVILVMDRERVGDYNRMARTLRDAGIRAEMYLGTSGMKAQMKYADRRGAPCVVIQGGDELARGEVTIKDLIEGDRLSGEIADNQAWREGRPAQFSVQQSELVEAVRSVLARHGKAAS